MRRRCCQWRWLESPDELLARRPGPCVPPRRRARRPEYAHRGLARTGRPSEVSVTGPLDRLAHELADVVYVAYGTALAHGIDLDAVIAEIHRSNMTKRGPDGRVARRADGKILKGDHYEAPDVSGVLRRQGWVQGDGAAGRAGAGGPAAAD